MNIDEQPFHQRVEGMVGAKKAAPLVPIISLSLGSIDTERIWNGEPGYPN